MGQERRLSEALQLSKSSVSEVAMLRNFLRGNVCCCCCCVVAPLCAVRGGRSQSVLKSGIDVCEVFFFLGGRGGDTSAVKGYFLGGGGSFVSVLCVGDVCVCSCLYLLGV